eukprot:2009164-Rhodomonas_salina.1
MEVITTGCSPQTLWSLSLAADLMGLRLFGMEVLVRGDTRQQHPRPTPRAAEEGAGAGSGGECTSGQAGEALDAGAQRGFLTPGASGREEAACVGARTLNLILEPCPA